MTVPPEYVGRESTFLKHRVLSEYLQAWAYKLASRSTRLWYVDCFAGPWHEKHQELRDTSVHIGLETLRDVASALRDKGRDLQLGAIFVEKNSSNRFKDDLRPILREQIRDFFGLEERDLPPGLAETALFELYRRQLRKKCGVKYACDLAIPHPTHDRTWFRLVVGGNHPSIVELFRTIERKVCGAEARGVRDEAKQRGERQTSLGLSIEEPDQSYGRLRREGRRAVPEDVLMCLQARSPQRYADLWPTILSDHHISKHDLNEIVWDMHKKKRILLRNLSPNQRTARDENVLAFVPG